MRIFISFLLLTFAVGLLADEITTNRVTVEFLTSCGFVQSKSDTNVFTLERVTVREAAKRLGFSPDQMMPTPSQSLFSDVRIVKVRNLRFVVSSEVRDSQDRVVSGSLDKPDAICTVSVALTQAPDTRKKTPKGKQPPDKLTV
jgi:hypothetical protein